VVSNLFLGVILGEVNSGDYNTMISSGDGTSVRPCIQQNLFVNESANNIVNPIMIVLIPLSVSIKESSMPSRDAS
jgi:hypothetical protein